MAKEDQTQREDRRLRSLPAACRGGGDVRSPTALSGLRDANSVKHGERELRFGADHCYEQQTMGAVEARIRSCRGCAHTSISPRDPSSFHSVRCRRTMPASTYAHAYAYAYVDIGLAAATATAADLAPTPIPMPRGTMGGKDRETLRSS